MVAVAGVAGRRVVVGADHAGYDLKEHLKAWLEQHGAAVEDLGTNSPDRVDYPDYGHAVARRVREQTEAVGLLVCGTGLGMSIAANRHLGVRAVVCSESYSARMARAHNDANVLCLGSRVIGVGVAESIVEAFLTSQFERGRHTGRVAKLETAD